MTLAQLQQLVFEGADWKRVEDWPRRTRLAALVLVWLLIAVALLVVVLRPAWLAVEQARAEMRSAQNKLVEHQRQAGELPALQRELGERSMGRDNPLIAEQMLDAVRRDHVSALESNGQVQISGRGSFHQLLGWVGSVGTGEPVLAEWKSMHIARGQNDALEWDVVLMPLKLGTSARPSPFAGGTHATRVGGDPFAIKKPAMDAVGTIAHAGPALPVEQNWPPPTVSSWPLSSLRFVGTVGSEHRPDALLMAGQLTVYRVRNGQSIGLERARIQHVHARGIETTMGPLSLGPQKIGSTP